MTVNTEGFDSKCMWYLYGDCILTKYSFYRSALPSSSPSANIFHWNAIPLYTATPYITPNVSFPKCGGIKGEDCIYGETYLVFLIGGKLRSSYEKIIRFYFLYEILK